MVKYFDNRFYSKVSTLITQATELKLVQDIISNSNFLDAFEQELKNEKSLLLETSNFKCIDEIRSYINTSLAMLCAELEHRTKIGKNTNGAEN